MSDRQTRCPQCQVTFAVQQIHLDAANGLVRCGACLTVFAAHEHREGEWQQPEPAAPPADDIADIGLAPDLDDLPDIDSDLDSVGDELIDQLLSDQTIDGTVSAEVIGEQPSGTDHLREADDKPEDAAPPNRAEPLSSETSIPEPVQEPIPQPELELPAPESKQSQPRRAAPELSPLAEQVLLEADRSRDARRGRKLASLLILMIGALGLVGQYAWFNSSELSLNLKYRPYLEPFCQQLNCPLAELRDLSRIKASNLIIRAHPEQADAISVDLLLQNIAAYEQRFPSLILVFTNIQGAPVAQRKFAPKEYLQGELSGAVSMPRNQQIRIALELVDPGPEALNYQVRLAD